MLKQLLSFDTLIGTKLIRVVYFIGLAVIALIQLFGLALIADGAVADAMLFLVLFGPAFALLMWRFSCELSMLSFRIGDDLREIKLNKLGQSPAAE